MYKVGDIVIYGKQGVCRIEGIGPLKISSANGDMQYYTLVPIYGSGRTYTPVETSVYMRPVMTFKEVQEIIKEIPNIEDDMDLTSNTREMTEYYKNGLNSHNWEDLVQIIKTVYLKEEKTKEAGKKLGQTDEKYRKEAEDLLYQEFAVALDIPLDNVESYIADAIEEHKIES